MGRDDIPGKRTTGHRAGRVIRQGLWMAIPLLSVGFFACMPAVHVALRARTRGWFLTAAASAILTASQWVAMANDADGAGPGLLIMGSAAVGLAAAAAGREIVFGPAKKLDPAVGAVLATANDVRMPARSSPSILQWHVSSASAVQIWVRTTTAV